jgi:F-type H+-transporting ATPase subunit epsilon
MNLKVLLPFHVFAEKTDVLRIVAETADGYFGLLPHRRDCVAALEPGILTYETGAEGAIYVAVDRGVLVKYGSEVLVSVRRAIAGSDLDQLQESVKRYFLTLTEQESDARAAAARMEGIFMRHLEEFSHGR